MPKIMERLSNRQRRGLIVAAVAIAAIYIGIAIATDAQQLKGALFELGLTGCFLVLGLSAGNYVLRFFRWQYYIEELGGSLPALRHLTYYLAGFAFTVSPAKAGEAVRSIYLRDHGVTYAQSIAAFFVERLLDLCAMVVLASLLAVDHPGYRPLLGGVCLVVFVAVIAACQPRVPQWLEGFADHRNSRIGAASLSAANLLRSSRRLLHLKPLLLGAAVGTLSWGAEGVGFYIVCHTLQIDVSVSIATGIYAISALAGSAVFFLPAGIGGMEVVMTALLVERGATVKVALIATLLCRLATLWFAVLLGIIAALSVEFVNGRRKPERILESE